MTFYNTMLSRMGSIKAGRLSDPETSEDLSDVEATLSGLGIKLRDSESEFRNFGDVLAEVGGKWESFSSVQQRAIATAFAGTRQQTRFLSLMAGWGKAQEYAEVAAESAGTALEKFSVYEESIEYKTNRMTSAFENLSTTILDSGLVGGIIDFGTGLLKAGAAMDAWPIKLALIATAAVGAVTAIKTLQDSSIGKALSDTMAIIPNMIARLNALGAVTGFSAANATMLGSAFSSMTTAQIVNTAATKGMSEEQLRAALQYSILDDAVKEETIAQFASATAKGANTAAGAAQAAGNGLLTFSWKSVTLGIIENAKALASWMLTNPVGWIVGIGAAFAGLAAAINNNYKKLEENIQKANDLKSAYKDAAAQIRSSITSISSVKDEFEQLSHGVDKFGNNISLSNEEYQRYLEIVNQIVAINPEIVEGYDEANNAIIDKNTAISETIKLLKEQQRTELLSATTAANNWAVASGAIAEYKLALNNLKRNVAFTTDGIKQGINQALSEGSVIGKNNIQEFITLNGIDAVDAYNELASVFDTKGTLLELYGDQSGDPNKIWEEAEIRRGMQAWNDLFLAIGEASSESTDIVVKNAGLISKYVSDESLVMVQASIRDSNTAEYALKSASKVYQTQAKLITQSHENYESLSDSSKAFVDSWIRGIKFDETTTKDMAANIDNQALKIVDAISGSNSISKELNDLFTIDADAITIGDYGRISQKINDFIERVESASDFQFSDEAKRQIRMSLGFDVGITANDGTKYEDVNEYLLETLKKKLKWSDVTNKDLERLTIGQLKLAVDLDLSTVKTWEELLVAIKTSEFALRDALSLDDVLGNLSDLEDKFSTLSSALGEFRDNGIVSASTLDKFKESFGQLDGFSSFVNTLSNTSSTLDQVKASVNSLAAEYLNSTKILEGLTSETANTTIAELESIGVVNAAEIVNARLAAQRWEMVIAANSQADAEWLVVENLLKECGAAEEAISQIRALRIAHYNAKIAAVDFSNVNADTITSLLAEAKAAGVAAKSISALTLAKNLQSDIDNAHLSSDEQQRLRGQIEALLLDAQDYLSGAELVIPSVSISMPKRSGSSKEIEEYIAVIDRLYASTKKLEDIQNRMDLLEEKSGRLNADEYEKKNAYLKEIIGLREQENQVLNEQNNIRREMIQEGVDKLRSQGFSISYDAANNDLLVRNMEHLNELFSSNGKTEDTNTLRKAAEALIKDITGWNNDAIAASLSWHENLSELNSDLAEFAANIKDASDEWTNDLEHNIKLMQNQGEKEDKIISVYESLMDYVHGKAEEIRAAMRELGKTSEEIEASDEIQALQDQWWEYYNAIKDIKQEQLDNLQALVDLTKDMIKQEKEDLVDALESQKDAYADLIALKKKSLELTERERSYTENVNDKTKEISKLQARIDALGLDDSRSAQAERGALLEQLLDKQRELEDLQREHSLTAQQEALDQDQKNFESAKDKEIQKIRDFLKDNEAMTKAALGRIDTMNASTFDNLLSYAKRYTSIAGAELETMWDKGIDSAKRYGSVTDALFGLKKESGGDWNEPAVTNAVVTNKVKTMQSNSLGWQTASAGDRERLVKENERLAAEIEGLIHQKLVRGADGEWYIGSTGGKRLYEVYHEGTPSVGGAPTPKQNELWALMQKKEMVLKPEHQDNLYNFVRGMVPKVNLGSLLSPLANIGQMFADMKGGHEIKIDNRMYFDGYVPDDYILSAIERQRRRASDLLLSELGV